jgi:NAD(P)-dependent dehydrogenase (short-subunit alcohol dehydrogenase family)
MQARMRVLVTGATDGLGEQVAVQLAAAGHAVVVHGRDPAKVDAVVSRIASTASQPAAVEGIVADFSDLKQVRRMAVEVAERFPDLNALINNAATWSRDKRVAPNGRLELCWTVNHLAPLSLTEALLPLLQANGQRSEETPSRVVFVSSNAHLSYPNEDWHDKVSGRDSSSLDLEWDNLQGEKSYDPYRAYALNKLCNVMTANWFAQHYPVATCGVVFNSLSPGMVNTSLLATCLPDSVSQSQTREAGARHVTVMLDDQVTDGRTSGQYFSHSKTAQCSPLAGDEVKRERLITLSRQQVRQACGIEDVPSQ